MGGVSWVNGSRGRCLKKGGLEPPYRLCFIKVVLMSYLSTSKKNVNVLFFAEKFLKVVSTTFSLVCFVCLNERTCKTRKNVFCFTSKALFIFEIIKFQDFHIFKCYDVIKCLSMKHETCFILLNNLGSKQPGNKIWPVYVTLQNDFFYHKTQWKMWPGN